MLLLILTVISITVFTIYLLFIFKIIEMYSNNMPVFVVHLKRNQERKKNIDQMLKKANIKFNYFDAVDGKNMNDSEKLLAKKYFKEGKLIPGQRGCFLSHILLFEKIIKDNYPNTLILEDDAVIKNFSYMKKLDSFLIPNYDIIFLGHCSEPKKGELIKEFFSLHKGTYPRCTHAYIISQKGARKFLNYLSKGDWDLPIDELIPRSGLIIYSMHPQLVEQSTSLKSDIDMSKNRKL